jgi:hypothetical protein
MKLALCMVVKDEIHRIVDCLDPIRHLVDQIVIIDTGSSDGTPDLLRRRYGIEPLDGVLEEARCYCLSDLRNRAFNQAAAPWILSLDADERIAPELLTYFRTLSHAPDVAGYFGRWTNHLDGAPPFEDYKLFLFRKGLRKQGLVHDNVQIDIRQRGQRALWLQGLEVTHLPDPAKLADKTRLYRWRLERAIALEPDWLRYRWFLGYMDFQAGDLEAAAGHLTLAAYSASPLFTVECLNSRMVLADIHARRGERESLGALLADTRRYFAQVADDFEVAINFRFAPWLARAGQAFDVDDLESIRAYRFAR